MVKLFQINLQMKKVNIWLDNVNLTYVNEQQISGKTTKNNLPNFNKRF